MTIRGGCLCGQVRYTAADATMTVLCHCTHCQKQAGSAFSIVVVTPKAGFSVEGPIKTYVDKGDSGADVLRRFCEVCGSPIVTEADNDLAIIKAGTLDDTSSLKPTVQLYCDSAQPWVELGGMKGFKKGFGSGKVEA